MLKLVCQYFHTLRYLKWQQFAYRVYYKLKPRIKPRISTPQKRETKISWLTDTPQVWFSGHTINLLNQHISIEPLDKLWLNINSLDPLRVYTLHYFHFLQADPSIYLNRQTDLLNTWILHHQHISHIAWSPYPSSLRIVNWIKWDLVTNALTKNAQINLAQQVKFLNQHLEYHLLGNHLFANIKALIFAGLYFQHPEADKWYKKGITLLCSQLKEQITPDGGHFELSPMYHAIILEDILDIIQLHTIYQHQLPFDPSHLICNMLDWLFTLTHPDGEFAHFNDTSIGDAKNLTALASYAKHLGITWQAPNDICLVRDGYYHVYCHKQMLIFDAAEISVSYLTGHAHADSLSFELSYKGQRILVNTGTSEYHDLTTRLLERSTAAHNTVTINKLNSSQVWSKFRTAKRVKIISSKNEVNDDEIILRGAHNGYRKHNITHIREIRLTPNQTIIIDKIIGKGQQLVTGYFHCHPNIVPQQQNNIIELTLDNKVIAIMHLPTESEIDISASIYSPSFGKKIPNKRISYTVTKQLPLCTTKIDWV